MPVFKILATLLLALSLAAPVTAQTTEPAGTIAAETVVVVQWTFTGTHTGTLKTPAFGKHVEPTSRTIQIRGISVYDVSGGLIQRETLYMDFATLWVELGVEL